jgi:hypothetical protein
MAYGGDIWLCLMKKYHNCATHKVAWEDSQYWHQIHNNNHLGNIAQGGKMNELDETTSMSKDSNLIKIIILIPGNYTPLG